MVKDGEVSEFGGMSKKGKSIAVVSGKGGSGKTMVAVAIAQGAALAGQRPILFDADFATGGLTYYLTFREFKNVRSGFADIIKENKERKRLDEWATVGTPDEPDKDWIARVRLISIGDQRRISNESNLEFFQPLQEILVEASGLGDLVIVDCRGGIDEQSLAVCQIVDEILVVVETDTTSIRSSQHLVERLLQHDLKSKIAGFIINKVMDDPTSIAKTVNSLLGIPYLGSVPFDIEATRSYIQGWIPDKSTLFSRHVFALLPKIMNGVDNYSKLVLLSSDEFGSVTLKSPEVRLGGVFVLTACFYASFLIFWLIYFNAFTSRDQEVYVGIIYIFSTNLLMFMALSDPIKQSIGRFFRVYIKFSNKLLGRGRSGWF